MKRHIKPRNPLVVPAKFRKAGSHDKPFKTQRRHDRVALSMACSINRKQYGGSDHIPTFF